MGLWYDRVLIEAHRLCSLEVLNQPLGGAGELTLWSYGSGRHYIISRIEVKNMSFLYSAYVSLR